MGDDLHARVARWCAQHHGVIALDEHAPAGVSERTVLRAAERGILVRVHDGVYRHAAHPPTFGNRLRAAVLAGGAEAYVAGHSLMRLYGVRGTWSGSPHIAVVGEKHLELEGVRIRRLDRLDPRDIRQRDGLPALAPPLGLLLLGSSAHPEKVKSAVHDMVFLGLTTRGLLVDAAVRYGGRGRRGVAAFRRGVLTLDRNGRATETNFELGMLDDLLRHGADQPELQFPVVDGDGIRRRLDFAWPDRGLDLEADGDRWHLSPPDRARMATRDDALGRASWQVVRVGESEWELDRAGARRRILDALAARG